MRSLTVITCFSYIGNAKYLFNPNYLRSDLRRILAYSLNHVQCSLSNIYVVTDILPDNQIKEEILQEFQDEVNEQLQKLGYYKLSVEQTLSPISWLHQVCHKASVYLKISRGKIFNKIVKHILPILRNSNVVEFASLFTKFVKVKGSLHYDLTLQKIFTLLKPGYINYDNLFFYYTGHGIRHWTTQNGHKQIKDICLVVPARNGTSEPYSRKSLRKTFQIIPPTSSCFIVFDCCHAESLIDLPFKITFNKFGETISKGISFSNYPDMVYLASTQHNQTCGFYVSTEECGSVFTYYLIKCLEKLSKKLKTHPKYFYYLNSEVEEKINEYRIFSKKSPQNMLIRLNRNTIVELPTWLFPTITPKI